MKFGRVFQNLSFKLEKTEGLPQRSRDDFIGSPRSRMRDGAYISTQKLTAQQATFY